MSSYLKKKIIDKYRYKYPERRDAHVVTGRDSDGWWLAIFFGRWHDNGGNRRWNESYLTDSNRCQSAALYDVLNMFDLDARGDWTPLTNMDDSDEEDDDDDDDGLGGITQGMRRMGY